MTQAGIATSPPRQLFWVCVLFETRLTLEPRPPTNHTPAPSRRFQAVLHTGPGAPGSGGGAAAPSSGGSGAATFRVVENNDFKQLAHISLAFRAGSDAAVKQFLAFRLGELRTDCSQLSAELERTQVGSGGLTLGGCSELVWESWLREQCCVASCSTAHVRRGAQHA